MMITERHGLVSATRHDMNVVINSGRNVHETMNNRLIFLASVCSSAGL